MNKKRKITTVVFMILLAMCMLTGCGSKKKQELETYKTNMENFCKNISYLNDQINSIDTTSDTATKDLLGYLDTLNDQFSKMAALSVPTEFDGVDDLADQASENMTNAVTYYHQAYEGETFNQNYADAASEYYRRANVRLKYILMILHGEDISTVESAAASASATEATAAESESVPASGTTAPATEAPATESETAQNGSSK